MLKIITCTYKILLMFKIITYTYKRGKKKFIVHHVKNIRKIIILK